LSVLLLWRALTKPRKVWRPLVLVGLTYAWFVIALITLATLAMTLAFLATVLGL
jgi:hypothetical protein